MQADKRRIKDKLKARTEERYEAALTLSAVKEAIHSVENPIHRERMERYYLKGQTWEQIAERMHYSINQPPKRSMLTRWRKAVPEIQT